MSDDRPPAPTYGPPITIPSGEFLGQIAYHAWFEADLSRPAVDWTELSDAERAAISPGNSGGALLNGRGQVVGISVAYIPPEQGAVSIGFAIPAATAVDVVGDLLRTGRATHAYLGIEPAPVSREVAAQLGLDQAAGVLVMEVGDGTPAARAGLQPGDVIVRLDDKPIDTVEDLFGELRQHRPGDRVTLTLIRDGREQQITATLADNPNG